MYTHAKENKEINVIIRAKILHHPMRGDRSGFSTVVASLFLLVPRSYYCFIRSFLQAPTVGFPFHTIFGHSVLPSGQSALGHGWSIGEDTWSIISLSLSLPGFCLPLTHY